MHPDPQIPDWMERLHSGKATREEIVRLQHDAEVDQARLEEECRLNRLLDVLPPVSVPSNLASRVLDSIHLDEERTERTARRNRWPSWPSWRPAWASLAVASIALVGWRIQAVHRATLAQNVLIVSEATALPGMDALADFEAIQWLESRPEPGDLELMAALTTP